MTPGALLVDAATRQALEESYQRARTKAAHPTSGESEDLDYDQLFEEIKETMPPERAELLVRYADAAMKEASPRKEFLLERLASRELDNVPR